MSVHRLFIENTNLLIQSHQLAKCQLPSQSAAEEQNSQNYRQNFSGLKPKEIRLSPLLRPKFTLNTNSIFFHVSKQDLGCSEGSSSVPDFSKKLS